jgi:transcriptional regulator CtsR
MEIPYGGDALVPSLTLADQIEAYLLRLLAERTAVELQRTQLAQQFACAPSQINYVLLTRFTPARGFLVESRRGGGGYIRVVRIPTDLGSAVTAVPESLSQTEAEHVIDRLREDGLCGEREAQLMRAAVDRNALGLPLPLRDRVRASVLRAMVAALVRTCSRGEGRRNGATGRGGASGDDV